MKIFDKEFAFFSLNANDIGGWNRQRQSWKRPRRPSVSVHSRLPT